MKILKKYNIIFIVLALVLCISSTFALFNIFNKTNDSENLGNTTEIETNIFENKTMACLGDSITYGYITKQGGQYDNPYPKLLQETLGLKECYNYGVGSSTLSNGDNSYKSFLTRYTEMPEDLDIIAVWGGTNDYSRGIPLGTPADKDGTTIYGALHTLAQGLRAKYPNAYIFFMSPTPRKDNWTNSQGYKIEDVGTAVSYISNYYGFGFLDMFKYSGFESEMNSTFTDGLHPSQFLVETNITPTIAQFIKDNYNK